MCCDRRPEHARGAGRTPIRNLDRAASAGGALRGGRGGGDADAIRGKRVIGGMKQTTFDEFKELARRGTFVPVVKEIMADLLTPVSAFLKIAEHSDYAFLFESVEGGEQVARYSFLGKDPFLVLRARGGRRVIDRSGVTPETNEPFVPVLRRLMAEFRAPFVQGLPRFTGGAVGFIGYDASIEFEPALAGAWKTAKWTTGPEPGEPGADDAGFMLFDTVLA